jgi:hypothetical protein
LPPPGIGKDGAGARRNKRPRRCRKDCRLQRLGNLQTAPPSGALASPRRRPITERNLGGPAGAFRRRPWFFPQEHAR